MQDLRKLSRSYLKAVNVKFMQPIDTLQFCTLIDPPLNKFDDL